MTKYINNKKEILSITPEECAEQPLRDWDTTFNFYTWHQSYDSMQEQSFADMEDWVDSVLGDDRFDITRKECLEQGKSKIEFINTICDKLDKAGIFAIPISMIDHGGIQYYLGADTGWDISITGFVWQYKADLYKEYDVKRLTKNVKETLQKHIQSYIDIYNAWCSGEVYEFILEDQDGEILDSCCGFYQTDGEDQLLEDILEYVATEDFNFVKLEEEKSMPKMKTVKEYRNFTFSTGGQTGSDYKEFENIAKKRTRI